ncbi:MAG: pyruvate, phosphate dikinase [Bifidobacteriaceae bacterium]|jgi:pyruvate,orthophosphate dikinase|nr:pyruvate, phosphate dikinase [Bifidobacteriaceae bacterium]
MVDKIEKYVYKFSEGNAHMRNLLGGKGANLAEMTVLELPVPQGFTVTTEACTQYYEDQRTISERIKAEIFANLKDLEKLTSKKFGSKDNPLLVSVRSGARASMPGMMDTILNLGLNDEVVKSFAKLTNNPRFAYDSYRRFIQMFSDVVVELDKAKFEKIIDDMKKSRKINLDTEFTAEDLQEMIKKFKEFFKKEKGYDFPQEPRDQLIEAIEAVFRSWDNPRANVYRKMNEIPYSWGTAVNIQEMVFGNMGDDSGTGVAFTRSPSTGENKLFGEFLINAQGEDVVAGIRTPMHIDKLSEIMPEVYKQFAEIASRLEKHYHDMQDMEFTIEKGKLFMLQTRNGKRTANAALRIAVEMVRENMITQKQALLSIDPKQLDSLLHPRFDDSKIVNIEPLGAGLPASPGAATGQVVFTAEEAVKQHEAGKKVILVRLETSPEDIEGMNAAEGILTVRGGMTSHAAVVARGMGVCCVAGAGDIVMSESGSFELGGVSIQEGDWISLDGSTGNIYEGELPTVQATLSGDLAKVMRWADSYRDLEVRANAETPQDARQALEFGAQGIGLCRTEHMFFGADRIKIMREMIIAASKEEREKALEKLLPLQRDDFEKLFTIMEGKSVTIRLLDPPLHEFLPHDRDSIEALAKDLGKKTEIVVARINSLKEINPMMGFRGCRLSVKYPEITRMQITAIIEAAINLQEKNISVVPEIMIPLVGSKKELDYVKSVVITTANDVIMKRKTKLNYLVGSMIEVPKACIIADELAEQAEFFSFGTNDLTQLGFGFSRDDAAGFLESYYYKKIFESDPFEKLDQEGIGPLVKMASEKARATKKDIKLGICGEHGGDPTSIEFFHLTGLDYVSCSPYRVPVARLAAAQSSLRTPRNIFVDTLIESGNI